MLFLPMTNPALAHEGGAVPGDVWTHWNTNLLMLTGIMLPLTLYVRGAATYSLSKGRTICFLGGITCLFVALISPLDAMSAALFSAHMVQHLLLMLVAAPLLAFSRPLPCLLRSLPLTARKGFGRMMQAAGVRRFWHGVTRPMTALALHIVIVWLWHIPGFYSAALNEPVIHLLEHASFFASSALFWWTLRTTEHYGGRVLAVFIVMMASGLLGALMTFAPSAWYADHAATVSAWGFTLLEDQQLAGLFMWIPAGVVYVVAAALLMGRWLNSVERRVVEHERRLVKDTSDA